jgi:phosphoribosylformimino-5-aminoimidazole carboxamide ribotide isomerase
VVVGTAVIEDPDFGIQLLEKFGGEKIAFGFDAIDQILMTQGWQTSSETSMITLAKKFSASGAKTIIYTNIKKDGMQTGVDWENAKLLASSAGVSVIASGGVAKLEDIAQVKKSGLAGVIIGRALYEGNFTLKEAINVS